MQGKGEGQEEEEEVNYMIRSDRNDKSTRLCRLDASTVTRVNQGPI
jgi:hypothetical protein